MRNHNRTFASRIIKHIAVKFNLYINTIYFWSNLWKPQGGCVAHYKPQCGFHILFAMSQHKNTYINSIIARNTGHCVRTGLNVVGTIYIDIQL